jgi:c-di-GMP-binding flagellar brake protein YcgR
MNAGSHGRRKSMAPQHPTARESTAPESRASQKRALETPAHESSVRLFAGAMEEFKERRRRRRVAVPAMYTFVNVRVLGRRGDPLEGHVLDISESGMAVQVDEQIGVGHPVTVEFSIAGLGRQRAEGWPTYAIAAEVVRIDDLADFPAGPYRTALRFVRIPTMVQAQIARYVVMQPTGKK